MSDSGSRNCHKHGDSFGTAYYQGNIEKISQLISKCKLQPQIQINPSNIRHIDLCAGRARQV